MLNQTWGGCIQACPSGSRGRTGCSHYLPVQQEIRRGLYTAWAKLKRGTQPLADISNNRGVSTSSNPASASDSSTSKVTPSLPTSDCGWLLDDVLKISVQQQAQRTNRGTARLPKHSSGEEMVKFLEERKMQKIRELRVKEERKAEREAKKNRRKRRGNRRKRRGNRRKRRGDRRKRKGDGRKNRNNRKAAKKASQKSQKEKTAGGPGTGTEQLQQQHKALHTTDRTVCPCAV